MMQCGVIKSKNFYNNFSRSYIYFTLVALTNCVKASPIHNKGCFTACHERFLQARIQRCFQLFLDDGVKYCVRGKNGVRENFLARAIVSQKNCSKPP